MSRSLRESSLLNTTDYRSLSVGVVPSNEYLIATTVVGATPAASIEFDVSDYVGIYRHLKIIMTGRSAVGGDNDVYRIQLNGDTSANYSSHRIYGNGSSILVNGYPNEDWMRNLGVLSGDTSTAGAFSAAIIDILDPFETTKYTTARSFSGTTSKTLVAFNSGSWRNTAPVTSILIDGLSGSFVQYSRFSIYGVTA